MTKSVQVYSTKPEGFAPHVEVAACYLEVEGKLLLLQCAPGKTEVGKWGVPAGKLEKEEHPANGAKRELFEETAISLEHPEQLKPLGTLYVCRPDFQYIYHLFKVDIDYFPEVRLSEEHTNYHWATRKELEEMPLMTGADQSLRHYTAFLEKHIQSSDN